MAGGTLTITGLTAGLLTGGQKVTGPLTMTGSSVIGEIRDLSLSSGDNTIAVPSGATAVLVVLPTSNTVTIKVRTNLNSSDGGLPVGLTGWLVMPLASGTTSLILNAASATGALELTFI